MQSVVNQWLTCLYEERICSFVICKVGTISHQGKQFYFIKTSPVSLSFLPPKNQAFSVFPISRQSAKFIMHPQKRTVIVISFFAWFAFVHAFPQQNVNLDFGDSALFTTQFPRQGPNRPINPMTESCLACICTASTNCNLTTQCISNGKYCGPFLISKPYWIDAGQLTIRLDQSSRDGAFFACATDPVCSSSTVRTYMQRYQTDCNNDGKIDCDDFSMLHLMGPDDCSNPRVPTTPFYKRFKTCHEKVLELSGS